MVDNHAARTAEQASDTKKSHSWVSKAVIFAIFAGVVAALVLLT